MKLKARTTPSGYETSNVDFQALAAAHEKYNAEYTKHPIYSGTNYQREVEEIRKDWMENPLTIANRSLQSDLDNLYRTYETVRSLENVQCCIINRLFRTIYAYFNLIKNDFQIGYVSDKLMKNYLQLYSDAIEVNKKNRVTIMGQANSARNIKNYRSNRVKPSKIMTNFERNPDKIKAAFESGLISVEDYKKYQGCHGYKHLLEKSIDNNEISKATYLEEGSKIHGVHFQRDLSTGVLRFKLMGAEFQPLDLLGFKEINKAKKDQLQKASGSYFEQTGNKTLHKSGAKTSNTLLKAGDIGRVIAESLKNTIASINKMNEENAEIINNWKKRTSKK